MLAHALSVHEGAAEPRLFLRLRFKWGRLWKTPSRTKILSYVMGIEIKYLKNVEDGSDDGDFKNNVIVIQQEARLNPNGQKWFSQI